MIIQEHRPLDHKRLVLRRKTEVARAIRMFSQGERGTASVATFMHEHDGSCCKKEPWPVTRDWILVQVGRKTLVVEQ